MSNQAYQKLIRCSEWSAKSITLAPAACSKQAFEQSLLATTKLVMMVVVCMTDTFIREYDVGRTANISEAEIDNWQLKHILQHQLATSTPDWSANASEATF